MVTTRSGSHQVLCYGKYKGLYGDEHYGVINKSTQPNKSQAEKVCNDLKNEYDKVEVREL